ncbi:MAG TPA: hypothetical protein DGH68_09255 [Bacteroidetes bacterium]|nr:hypothetical protein [Bacteroidota bacterium]
MNWKQKAMIQKFIAMLPSKLSYAVHYQFQRWFGGLRTVDPTQEHLVGAITIANYITRHGGTIDSKTFLELGPGRRVNLPIALWLCGASRIITVDINPYLKSKVVFENIAYLQKNEKRVASILGEYASRPIFRERFQQLLHAPCNLQALLKMLNIEYLAPADATHLDLPGESVDYYLSYNVLEYIPPEVLKHILLEGRRILRPGGLHVHSLDFSDWFAVSDHSISGIHFLQFNEEEWKYYAGNRYMYQNRLRVDDYVRALEESGLNSLIVDSVIDQRALQDLKSGFRLDEQFRGKSPETNATSRAWIVAARKGDEQTLTTTSVALACS